MAAMAIEKNDAIVRVRVFMSVLLASREKNATGVPFQARIRATGAPASPFCTATYVART
jgi:hypothetical protein